MININFKEFKIFRKRVKEQWLRAADNLWWGDRLDSRFVALYYLKGIKNKKVLDIGCNVGIVLSEMDASNFKVGFDICDEAIRVAKKLNEGSAAIFRGDALSIPLKPGSFDILVIFGMLDVPFTMGVKKRFIEESAKLLRDDGTLVLTVTNKRYPCRENKENKPDYDTLKAILEPSYDCDIYGFNPFPAFPYFVPNRIMEKVPFIWNILFFLMKKKIMLKYCRSFFVIAKKK